MLDSFLIALRVVVPMALLMSAGVLVRKVGFIDRPAMKQFDRLIFRLFMPVLLFKNIYDTNLSATMNGRLIAFAAAGMFLVFLLAFFAPPLLVKDRNKAATIGQAIIRSNYILFGVAVARSIFGESGVAVVALLGVVAVPATNAMSAVILEINRSGKAKPGQIMVSILKNPMVIAALLALALKLVDFRFPELIYSVTADIANVTTTVSFISLGVSLDPGELKKNFHPLSVGLVLRMLAVPAIFLPLSVAFGFRNQELCALMVLFAAPAAVGSYPMAVAMGADGPLAGQLVCTTTAASIFTMFCFTMLLRSLGLF